MIESVLLNKLKARQAQYALESLKAPGDKTEFEYGRRVGVVLGIEMAIEELLNMVAEEKSDRDDL